MDNNINRISRAEESVESREKDEKQADKQDQRDVIVDILRDLTSRYIDASEQDIKKIEVQLLKIDDFNKLFELSGLVAELSHRFFMGEYPVTLRKRIEKYLGGDIHILFKYDKDMKTDSGVGIRIEE